MTLEQLESLCWREGLTRPQVDSIRRELADYANAAVAVLDPSDTAALTAIRRRILDQAQSYRWPSWRLKPCGTTAAYRRHLRHGEPACFRCMDANAADWRARHPNPDGTGRRPRNRRKGTR